MAGEIESGWVRMAIEAGALLVSFGGLSMYVRQKLKAHDDQLGEHKQQIGDLQRQQSNNVRPQDIAILREDIRELRKLIIESKQ